MNHQLALPIAAPAAPARLALSPGLAPLVERLSAPERWPFRTAVLTGPPRSGKSLIARWFVEAGLGEAVDDADRADERDLFHRWNRTQAGDPPLLLVQGAAGPWRIALPDLASRVGAALRLEIPPPDDALLAALIEVHAARRGIALGDGAAAWLLPRIERSHAAVEALLAHADRLSLERKAPVTISLLRDAIAGDDAGGASEDERQPRLL